VRTGGGSVTSNRGNLSVSFNEPPPAAETQVQLQEGADTKGAVAPPVPALSLSAGAKGPDLKRSATAPPLTLAKQRSEDSALTLRFFKSRRSKAASRLPWEEISIAEVEEVLGTDRRNGLSQQEATVRLQRDGQHTNNNADSRCQLLASNLTEFARSALLFQASTS
jgi:hypothetical protein